MYYFLNKKCRNVQHLAFIVIIRAKDFLLLAVLARGARFVAELAF
jgi:hypothetical protein